MKSKKILAAILAIAMVMSVYVALEQVTDIESPFGKTASAVVLGVDNWQGASHSGYNDILNQTTTALYYGQTQTLTFNGGAISADCYIYKPSYQTEYDSGSGQYEVWTNYTKLSGAISSGDAEPTKSVAFDRAGMWLIVADDAPTLHMINMSTRYIYDASQGYWEPILGWFWVNSSSWSISLSKNSVYYDKNESLTITVKDGDGVPVTTTGWIDIWNVTDDYLHTLVYHKELAEADEGVWTISGSLMHTLTHDKGAGTYRVTAYEDIAPGHTTSLDIYGDTGGYTYNGTKGYNATFGDVRPWHGRFMDAVGSTTTNIRNYNGNQLATSDWSTSTYKWSTCGPFNPPEYWADYTNFTVLAGVPTFTITNGTQFYNDTYDNEVKIKITDYSAHNISWNGDVTVQAAAIEMFNKSNKPTRTGSTPIPDLLNKVNISISGDNNDILKITPRNVVGGYNRWGYNTSDTNNDWVWAEKGTVYIRWANSSKANNSEEWNGTLEINLVRAQNQFKWVADGSSTATGYDGSTDITDGILGEIPAIAYVPIWIQFKIINSDYNYFGSSNSGSCTTTPLHCAQNITVSGNSIFTGTLDAMPGYADSWYTDGTGTWRIPIIPTMATGRGEIKIAARAWNKTITGTLIIGGTIYWTDGSVVSVSPNVFSIDDQDQTLTITVKDSQGNLYGGATFYLCYMIAGNPDQANYLTPSGGVQRDSLGNYMWNFNQTQQTTNQTNSFASILAPRNLTVYVNGGAAGYGYALIDMLPMSDFEVTLSHTTMMAGKVYNDFTIDTGIFGTNDTPSTLAADKNNFYVKIYNERGDDVTATFDSSGSLAVADLTGSDAYLFDDGGSGFDGVYCVTPGIYTFYAYNNTHDSTGHNGTLEVKAVTVTCDMNPFIWMSDSNISATFTITYGSENITGYLRIDNMSAVTGTDGLYNKTYTNTSFNGDDDQCTGNDSVEIDYEDITSDGAVTVHDITANYLVTGAAEQFLTVWFKPINADDEEGGWARAVVPAGHGRIRVAVPTVSPKPLFIPMGKSTTVTIDVMGRDSQMIGDVFVRCHGAGVDVNGTSTATGSEIGKVKLSLNPQVTGNISLDVGAIGRTVEDIVITATGWVLNIVVSPNTVDEGQTFTVTVTREDDNEPVDGATVKVLGYETKTGTQVPNGVATFTAPTVTSDRSYTITASHTGYAAEPDQITVFVTNLPALAIAADLTVRPCATYEIAVSNTDTGIGVVGATISIIDPDGNELGPYSTKSGGALSITVPKTTGEYKITATFANFQKAEFTVTVEGSCETDEEPTPGFELLTLIAAIGVAFILLRRRRKN